MVVGWLIVTSIALLAGLLVVSWRFARSRRVSEQAIRDVASARSTSQAAEREALRLGRILASMPDGVLVIEEHEVVYANPAAARLLGGDPARVVPMVRGSGASSVLVTVHHPVYREVRCTRTELDGDSLLIVARDVTEARRVDRMRHDFVANASHELKTPVAAILATADTLRSSIEDDPEASARFVDALVREAGRLSEIVQDLLDLARLDQAAGPVGETADAASVIAEVASEARERGKDAGVTVQVDPGEHVRVEVRASDLALAIRNLLDNAIRHTPSGGRIDVAFVSGDTFAEIIVRDTGEGIPAKDLPRIFERFYRVDRARSRETGGTGLGLAIVKHVVESAGGTVHAESTFGEGSTFTIRVPLADGA